MSILHGMPAGLLVLDEATVPSIDWQPSELCEPAEAGDRIKRRGRHHKACPLQPGACFKREDTVMGFAAKQVQALRRSLNSRNVCTREAHGRELSYIEGWYAILEANRIFGFDGWNRETVNPAVSWPGKTAGLSCPAISPGNG